MHHKRCTSHCIMRRSRRLTGATQRTVHSAQCAVFSAGTSGRPGMGTALASRPHPKPASVWAMRSCLGSRCRACPLPPSPRTAMHHTRCTSHCIMRRSRRLTGATQRTVHSALPLPCDLMLQVSICSLHQPVHNLRIICTCTHALVWWPPPPPILHRIHFLFLHFLVTFCRRRLHEPRPSAKCH
jgi:hypothetical protein